MMYPESKLLNVNELTTNLLVLELNREFGVNCSTYIHPKYFNFKEFKKQFQLISTDYSSVGAEDEKIFKCGWNLVDLGGEEVIVGTDEFGGWSGYIFYKSIDSAAICDKLLKFTNNKKSSVPQMSIIKSCSTGFYTDKVEIKKQTLDFENYNDGLSEFTDYTIDKLKEKNGIIILHGEAGTGKSHYIRGLINKMKKSKFIYVPPYMTSNLSDPNIIDFIIENKDSIFIIEDAEEVLKKQDTRKTAVSNILNFSDGLLGDVSNISFIFTFNMDIVEIDPALVRKGRLISKYEFKRLSKDKSEKLKIKLGVECESDLLADIFNAKDESFEQEKKSIGFK